MVAKVRAKYALGCRTRHTIWEDVILVTAEATRTVLTERIVASLFASQSLGPLIVRLECCVEIRSICSNAKDDCLLKTFGSVSLRSLIKHKAQALRHRFLHSPSLLDL